MSTCDLKLEFDFCFETALYLMRNWAAIMKIQAKHQTENSCYQNYFKEDLGALILRVLKLYESELRECSSIEILKEASKSTP